jgi:GT2 family glycosyltransferase
MSTEKLTYFIVIHWRNSDDTIACLESLRQLSSPCVKVILVNNGPPETVFESYAPKLTITIIQNQDNLGFAKANNQGIDQALQQGAEYICLLNNDTLVDKDFLQPLIHHCKTHPRTIVSPAIYRFPSHQLESVGGAIIPWLGITRLLKTISRTSPDYLSGACIFAKAEAFKEIGRLDESFFCYYEDLDWCQRAKAKGFYLAVVPESHIWHKTSASTKEGRGWGALKFYYMARNNLLFARKHLKGFSMYQWICSYLIAGSNLHLIQNCRNLTSLRMHTIGIWHGVGGKHGPF